MGRIRYRVTRPALYGPGTAGHTDVTARQGHYATASSMAGAAKKVRQRLGLDENEPLDVDVPP